MSEQNTREDLAEQLTKLPGLGWIHKTAMLQILNRLFDDIENAEHTTREDLSATPETDVEIANTKPEHESFTAWAARGWDFAKKKERENNQLRKERDNYQASVGELASGMLELRQQLTDERAKCERLEEACAEYSQSVTTLCSKGVVKEQQLTTTQARLAEAMTILNGWYSQYKTNGEQHLAAKVTAKLLSSTEPPAILKELEELRGELSNVDAVLARRPALDDCVTRYAKIEKAINTAKRVDDAEAKLAEVEKDKARLDWLALPDSKGGTNFVTNNQLGWEPKRICGVSVFPYFKHGDGWFETLRAAIDAAMKQTNK